ncbi:MAG: helix-turn-helix domain-containing protein [Ruminococcus sp.]|nr:helix-turn-helix domain-containing protein [Ruminococcus sp.]
MAFKDNLQATRISAGLTQQELAEKIGMTKVAICGYEKGTRKPDTDKLQALALALGCSTDALLFGKTAAHNT